MRRINLQKRLACIVSAALLAVSCMGMRAAAAPSDAQQASTGSAQAVDAATGSTNGAAVSAAGTQQAAGSAAGDAQEADASAAAQGAEEGAAEAALPLSLAMRLRSNDGSILISFLANGAVDHYAIEITGKTPVSVPGAQTTYTFTDGKHGQAYAVTVTGLDAAGNVLCRATDTGLFLNYSRLPALPLLSIETEDGITPTAETLNAPCEGMAGVTIKNAEYVKADITANGLAGGTVTASGKIKIRGNTSANAVGKKPYKLKFSEKIDLLGNGRADKEYVLLSTGTDLNTYIGDFIASQVGMDYVPQTRFVNVMLNGDWCGLYLLTETVEASSSRVQVGDSGFLIENDAYWWGEEAAFRTSLQPLALGYTLKYPEISGTGAYDGTAAAGRAGDYGTRDKSVTAIRKYMQRIEEMETAGDENVLNYIDADSFAGWLLARDILGQSDPAGSNMYYTKYDLGSDPATSLLQMGPLWDFDTCFVYTTEWSSQHTFEPLHFTELLKMPYFAGTYINKWQALAPTLVSQVGTLLDTLEKNEGKAIDESRALNTARWGQEASRLSDEIRRDKQYFADRTAWLNAKMPEIYSGALQ